MDMIREYVNEAPPSEPTFPTLVAWVLKELQALGSITKGIAQQQVDEYFTAPKKPRTGMIVFADGTSWNPGSGRGYYGYDAVTAAWRFLG